MQLWAAIWVMPGASAAISAAAAYSGLCVAVNRATDSYSQSFFLAGPASMATATAESCSATGSERCAGRSRE
jgi:hypothetical protein